MENFQQLINKISFYSITSTKKQKKICRFFLDHFKEVPFLSVKQIADATETSATSVLRVVQNMGYVLYKDFQKEIQELLYQETPTVFSRFFQTLDDTTDPLTYIIDSNCSDLRKNINNINKVSFNNAINLLVNARKNAFLGLRSSSFIAGYMYSMMSTFFDNCILIDAEGSDFVYERLQFLDRRDVLFAISIGEPYRTARTLDAIKYAKEKGVSVILLSSSSSTPTVMLADCMLVAHISRYNSLVSSMSIVDALLFEFFNRRKSLVNDNKLADTLIRQNILVKIMS